MVIGIFGESCTGKSTIAAALAGKLALDIYTGKDYLRLAKSESEARKKFQDLLLEREKDPAKHIVFVISEPALLSILPPGAIKVRVTADLDIIKRRFADRMNGNLPAPVGAMLEKKHGIFDEEACTIAVNNAETFSVNNIVNQILDLIESFKEGNTIHAL